MILLQYAEFVHNILIQIHYTLFIDLSHYLSAEGVFAVPGFVKILDSNALQAT